MGTDQTHVYQKAKIIHVVALISLPQFMLKIDLENVHLYVGSRCKK